MKNQTEIEEITGIAKDAFWASVAAQLPECAAGDLSPEMTCKLQATMTDAVQEWYSLNYNGQPLETRLPGLAAALAEHGLCGLRHSYESFINVHWITFPDGFREGMRFGIGGAGGNHSGLTTICVYQNWADDGAYGDEVAENTKAIARWIAQHMYRITLSPDLVALIDHLRDDALKHEWGSQESIDALTRYQTLMHTLMSPEDIERWAQYNLKATEEEIVAWPLYNLRKRGIWQG